MMEEVYRCDCVGFGCDHVGTTDYMRTASEAPPLRCDIRGKRIVHAHAENEQCPRRVMMLYRDYRISVREIARAREADDYVQHVEKAATEELVHTITRTLMGKPGTRNWAGRILRKDRMEPDFKEVRLYVALDSNDPFPVTTT